MELTHIIKYPILTEKTYQQMQANVYTFAVDRKATKFEIKRAVEFIFEVKVESINTFNVPRKPKRVGRFNGFVAGYKKAIIKLAEGSIQILPDEGIAQDETLKESNNDQIKAKVKEISDINDASSKILKSLQSSSISSLTFMLNSLSNYALNSLDRFIFVWFIIMEKRDFVHDYVSLYFSERLSWKAQLNPPLNWYVV